MKITVGKLVAIILAIGIMVLDIWYCNKFGNPYLGDASGTDVLIGLTMIIEGIGFLGLFVWFLIETWDTEIKF